MTTWETDLLLPRCLNSRGLLGYGVFYSGRVKCRRLHGVTSRFIFAFTCLEAMEFSQMVVRGLNISLSGNPSKENICSRETDKQREPVDRLTPAQKKK